MRAQKCKYGIEIGYRPGPHYLYDVAWRIQKLCAFTCSVLNLIPFEKGPGRLSLLHLSISIVCSANVVVHEDWNSVPVQLKTCERIVVPWLVKKCWIKHVCCGARLDHFLWNVKSKKPRYQEISVGRFALEGQSDKFGSNYFWNFQIWPKFLVPALTNAQKCSR